MAKSLKLIINDEHFTALLNDNHTVEDLLKMLPMELTLRRYAQHEYYSSLPKKPSIKSVPMTSDAYAGGLYYYDGWSAFTVLFDDAQIAPYEVVHLGDVNEEIISTLAASGDTVKVILEAFDIFETKIYRNHL